MAEGPISQRHGKCGAKTRSGGSCGKAAGYGTDHLGSGRCKFHGGSTASGRKAAEREQAEEAVAFFGLPREIGPHEALIEELHRTAGHVAFLGLAIRSGEIPADQTPTKRRRKVTLDGAFGGPSIYVALYERERRHFAELAKTCVAVGIEERRIQLAERQGELIADVILGVLEDLGVADKLEVPEVVRRHLTLVQDAA